MKNVYLGLILCASAMAQTKSAAPPAAPAKAPAAPTKAAAPAAKKAPAPAAPKPNLLEPSTLNAKAPAMFRVRLNTTKGPVVIEVTKAWSPNGADRFYNLVRAGFFTDLYFFRVVAGFMAQFGMHSKPEVAQVWTRETIQDDPVMESNTRGMVTFAKSGLPNSRSTQFFINYGDNSRLDSQGFAPFGKVIEGMEVIDMLYSGYGEESNDQGAIRQQGKAFFDAKYPMLDKIITATIVPAVPAAPKPIAPVGAAPTAPKAAPTAPKAPAKAPDTKK